MKNIVLNETPVRTSKNYGINNIEIKDFEEPVIKEFKNIRRLSNCSGDNLFVALISSICFLLIRVEEDTIKFFD